MKITKRHQILTFNTSVRPNVVTNGNCLSIYTLFLNFIAYRFILNSSKAVYLQ